MDFIKRFQTYLHRPHFQGEVNTEPSETVVGKSLSLKEIIARDLVGMIQPKSGVVPFYDETFVMPDFRRLDSVDLDIWKDQMDESVKHINKVIKHEKAERAQSLKDAADAKAASDAVAKSV